MALNKIGLNLKTKIIISIIIFVISIFSIVFFIVVPSIKDIRKIKNDIKDQQIDLEEKYLKGQSLRRLSTKIKQVEEEIKVLDQVFVDKHNGLDFITALENIANKNNITQKLNLVSPDEIDEDVIIKNNIQLSSKGSFDNIVNYLLDLEALNYYVNINRLEISSSKRDGTDKDQVAAQPEISAIISADTFWR